MSYRNGTRTEGRRLLPRAREHPQSLIILIVPLLSPLNVVFGRAPSLLILYALLGHGESDQGPLSDGALYHSLGSAVYRYRACTQYRVRDIKHGFPTTTILIARNGGIWTSTAEPHY